MIDFKLLDQSLASSRQQGKLFQRVADAPFEHQAEATLLFLGFISFFLADRNLKKVSLKAVSDTEQYKQAVNGYGFEPDSFELSLDDDCENDIVRTILTGKPLKITDWGSLSRRSADPGQARLNQASGGIAHSEIYPLDVPCGGALLYCYFQYPENIGRPQRDFMDRYTKLVAKNLTAAHKH